MSEAANELSLVLYDLTNEPGGTREFSPHCMKTIIDLKIIGVPYTRERLSFIQIRNDLATKLNSPDITDGCEAGRIVECVV
ncbi:hypothetical protein OC861_005889 [Tilletia horrida]|nr:hypothetical protein OC861_005889 [Tilletia horrida]